MITSKPASRPARGSTVKAMPLGAEASSMPEHVPDVAGREGEGAHAKSRDERIRQRAYELYLARGDALGSEHEDWVAAEVQIAASDGREGAPSEVGTAGYSSEVGEEDPGAAEGDFQVSRSMRAEAAASAPDKAQRARR